MRSCRDVKIRQTLSAEVGEGIGYLENRVVPEPPGTMGFIG
jgi:hypothetical protein